MSTSEHLQSSVSVEKNGHIRKLRTKENLNHPLMYCKRKESIYSTNIYDCLHLFASNVKP